MFPDDADAPPDQISLAAYSGDRRELAREAAVDRQSRNEKLDEVGELLAEIEADHREDGAIFATEAWRDLQPDMKLKLLTVRLKEIRDAVATGDDEPAEREPPRGQS